MSIKEDNDITQKIAENIRKARIDKGLRQSDVAKKAGLDTNSYAKIERGEAKPFGITLAKIMRALEVKSSEIFPF